ncbi:MAG: tetratricopeptide repeat protein [Gaiellales bacterium]
MLFEKIRRTQKPVFLFLAVMFGLGFALLGVGSSGNINALDFLHLGGGSSNPNSISSLNAAVSKDPNNAGAWIRLAQAYTAAGQPDQAVNAYSSYLRLRSKDTSALSAASTLLEQQAVQNLRNASAYQAAAGFYENGTGGSVMRNLPFGSSLTDPLATQQAQPYTDQVNVLSQQGTADFQRATEYRQSLARLDPKNAFNQEALGYDAYYARAYPTSAAAFKEFLKLTPKGSQQAKQVQSILKQVELLAKTSSTGTPPTTP